jgi:hypothetical protein
VILAVVDQVAQHQLARADSAHLTLQLRSTRDNGDLQINHCLVQDIQQGHGRPGVGTAEDQLHIASRHTTGLEGASGVNG